MRVTYHEPVEIEVDDVWCIRPRGDVWGVQLLKIGDERMYPIAVDDVRNVVTVLRNAQEWW